MFCEVTRANSANKPNRTNLCSVWLSSFLIPEPCLTIMSGIKIVKLLHCQQCNWCGFQDANKNIFRKGNVYYLTRTVPHPNHDMTVLQTTAVKLIALHTDIKIPSVATSTSIVGVALGNIPVRVQASQYVDAWSLDIDRISAYSSPHIDIPRRFA